MRKSIVKGVVKAFAITGALCAFISIIMLFVDLSDKLLAYISVALLALACYMSAYFSTQIKRTKGMIQGLLCGVHIFTATLIISVITGKFMLSEMFFFKLFSCVLFGMIGGVKGINTRHTKVT